MHQRHAEAPQKLPEQTKTYHCENARKGRQNAVIKGLPPPPLTAVIENPATSHDGESAFNFELRFSEEFGPSYNRLRDYASTVSA